MKLRKFLLASGALAAFTMAPAQASIIDNPHFKVLGLVIVWGADAADNTPIVSDFIIDTGTGTTALASGDHDLIGSDVHTVVTGSLTATPDAVAGASSPFDVTNATSGGGLTDSNSDGVLDATDTFGAFGLDDTTDVEVAGLTHMSSFYVASNVAFAIDADADVVGTPDNFTLADIGYSLEVTETGDDGLAFGARAQFPHSGGATGGVVATVDDLNDMATATPVFVGNQRTAEAAGSITQQSVRFDATYSLGGVAGYDLSMGAGEIETTVTYTVFVP